MLVHSRHSALFAAFSGAGSFVTACAASNFGQGPVPIEDGFKQAAGIVWGGTEFSLLTIYGLSFPYNAIDETKEKSSLAKGKRFLMRAFARAGKANLEKWTGAAAWTFLGAGNGLVAASAITTLMTVGTAGLAPALLASLYLAYGVSGVLVNAAKIYGLMHKEPENKVAKFMHDYAVELNFSREGAGLFYYAVNGLVDPNTTAIQTAVFIAGQLLTMSGYYALYRGQKKSKSQAPSPTP